MRNGLDRKKVVLGLSGGVDSAAAALLLKEKGYEVTGLYFDIKPEENASIGQTPDYNSESCGGTLSGRQRAEAAAEQLGISFIYRNVSSMFDDVVIENFCSEYQKGRTPNPCIVCNPSVKFKTLLETADEMGAYHIATGHYADTYYDDEGGTWYIKKAANERKDQSYMLYRLGQEAISRLILPLNEMDNKEQVRALAREKALKNADAKDSQEICFIEENDNYKDFLARRGITSSKGHFVDIEGNALGEHQGVLNYTVGQRKGLGIALGKPAFVTRIDSENNRVVLGDNEELFGREVMSSGNLLMGINIEERGESESAAAIGLMVFDHITAKIRYAAGPAEASLEIMPDGRIKTTFTEPQRAATPGQSIVFYKDDLVIGGGFIE